MAGSSLDIQQALANALTAVPGLRVADHLPEQINPPMAVIQLQSVTYHRAMKGGMSAWEYVVTAIGGRMADRAAQIQLDGWMSYDGAYSIRAAIEDDRTLGGVCDTLILTDMVAVRPLTMGDAAYVTCEFNVTVYA